MLTLLQDLPKNVQLGYRLLGRGVSYRVREEGVEDFEVVDLADYWFDYCFDWEQISWGEMLLGTSWAEGLVAVGAEKRSDLCFFNV